MSDPPAPLLVLLTELEERGFVRRTDEVFPESFGNRLIELGDGVQAVRLVRDRDWWSVDVWAAGDWRAPELVLAALDGREAADEPLTEDQMADSSREALARLSQGGLDSDALQRVINTVAVRRSRRIFG